MKKITIDEAVDILSKELKDEDVTKNEARYFVQGYNYAINKIKK